MELLLTIITGIIIVLIIAFGCWCSLDKKPRNTAKEIEDMIEESSSDEESYYNKFINKDDDK